MLLLQIFFDLFQIQFQEVCGDPSDDGYNLCIAFAANLVELILFNSIGVPLALIRLMEPYVFNNFKKDLRWFLNLVRRKICCSKKKIGQNFCLMIHETKFAKESL